MAGIQPESGFPSRAGRGGGAAGGKSGGPSRIVKRATAVVASDGTVTIALGTVPSGVEWLIERLSVNCTSQTQTDFALYEDEVRAVNRKDFTATGNDDTADANSPVWFASGQVVIAQWSGATALDSGGSPTVGSVNVQIRQEG